MIDDVITVINKTRRNMLISKRVRTSRTNSEQPRFEEEEEEEDSLWLYSVSYEGPKKEKTIHKKNIHVTVRNIKYHFEVLLKR
jgi:hypothetical protein